MATFEKRDNGKWLARVYLNGKYKSKTFATKRDAQKWTTSLENYKNQGQEEIFSGDITLLEYLKTWQETYTKNVRVQTASCYNSTIKVLQGYEFFTYTPINKIKRSDMQSFFNSLSKRYSISTIKLFKTIIKRIFNDALADNYIIKNPVVNISVTSEKEKHKEKFINEKDFLKFIEICNQEKTNYSDLYLLLALTGLRIGEALALEITDFKNQNITINKTQLGSNNTIQNTPKTQTSNRVVSLPLDFYNYMVSKYKNTKGCLFARSRNTYELKLKQLLKDNNLPMFSFHTLRHTHGSYLLSQGVDIQYISKRLGHANVSITLKIYTHLLKEKENLEIEKTNATLDKIIDFHKTSTE